MGMDVSRRATYGTVFSLEVPRARPSGSVRSRFRAHGGLTHQSVKEVIQPQVPLRLPCYDFAPVTALAFGRLIP